MFGTLRLFLYCSLQEEKPKKKGKKEEPKKKGKKKEPKKADKKKESGKKRKAKDSDDEDSEEEDEKPKKGNKDKKAESKEEEIGEEEVRVMVLVEDEANGAMAQALRLGHLGLFRGTCINTKHAWTPTNPYIILKL